MHDNLFAIGMAVKTPSTLDSCSYRFKMYLKAENIPFHVVKNIFKYLKIKAHIPLKTVFVSANFRVANAENDAQTT